MESDVICCRIYFVVLSCFGYVVVKVPCALNREVWVASDNAHGEVNSRICNHASDSAESDNSKGLATHLYAGKLGLTLFNLLCNVLCKGGCPFCAADNVAGSKHKSADNKLLYCVCICAGSVEYYDARLCAAIDRNIVDTRAGTSDRAKLGVEFHFKHVCGTNHNAVRRVYVLTHVKIFGVKLICANLGDLI